VSKTYYVYIVTNRPRGVVYVGVTNDLAERASAHKMGAGGAFAKKYNCTRLVYWEAFGEVVDAISREKRLKRWRRDWKIKLIETVNPEWRELATY
jgi:putative endonuclease